MANNKKKYIKTNKKQINESLFPLKNIVLIYPNKYDSKNLKRIYRLHNLIYNKTNTKKNNNKKNKQMNINTNLQKILFLKKSCYYNIKYYKIYIIIYQLFIYAQAGI